MKQILVDMPSCFHQKLHETRTTVGICRDYYSTLDDSKLKLLVDSTGFFHSFIKQELLIDYSGCMYVGQNVIKQKLLMDSPGLFHHR